MKAHSRIGLLLFPLLGLAVTATAPLRAQPPPLSTAFTYQGRLVAGGSPANGQFDLQLTLFAAPTGGNQVGSSLVNAAVSVSNGLFITSVDFGSGVFDGSTYWLEVAVRPSALNSNTPFRTLLPRQRLAGTPYALFAANAESANRAGTVPWSGLEGIPDGFRDGIDNDTKYSAGVGLSLTGTQFNLNFDNNGTATTVARGDHTHSASDITSGLLPDARLAGVYSRMLSLENQANFFAGDGSGLRSVDAATLTGFKPGEFWQLGGNSGTVAGQDFLGTTDPLPLELRVNNVRALLLEPHATSPNVIGGYQGNFTSTAVVGAAIAGGGTANDGFGLPRANRVLANFGTIGGGFGQTVNALNGFIGGGQDHTIDSAASYGTISGGRSNTVQRASPGGSIGGGYANLLQTNTGYGTVGGGSNNVIRLNTLAATIGGGRQNVIQPGANYATVPGGAGASAASYGQQTYASGMFAVPGDAQSSVYVLRNSTTNSAATELFLDGVSERISVPLNARWAFEITVVASSPATNAGAWQLRGAIRNLAGATSLLAGSPTPMLIGGEGVAGWAVNASTDAASSALIVRVVGPSFTIVRWVATVRTTELSF